MPKTKILLIEDDNVMRENTVELLQLSHYDVAWAENGKMGIKRALSFQPDLIICDIMMPELDGYSVLHLLSKETATAGIPFIFLTAKSKMSDMRLGMNMGADDYITKPFQDIELLHAIESRLERHKNLVRKYKHQSPKLSGNDSMTNQDITLESVNR
jgi:DNA-binding response OmpR family regulator